MTRREVLQILSAILPAAACKKTTDDVFADERVCVHVYNRAIALPAALLERHASIPDRAKSGRLFQIGIPELLICATSADLLMSFPYVWPVTRLEFDRARENLTVLFQRSELADQEDIKKLKRYVEDQTGASRPKGEKRALLVVLNDHTRYLIPDVLEIWRESSLESVVIFKDPTKSPYLCDFASLQKGFRRSPP